MSNATTDTPRPVHHGRNVKRIREILGIKQEALAVDLGEDWNQRRISTLEAREVLEPELIEQLAKAMKVPAEAIKSFSEEAAYNIIGNTIENNNNATSIALINANPIFNPIDKWMEALDKNEKLYEALLKSEREKVALLERLLNEKKK